VLTPHFLLSYESETDNYRTPTEFLRICKCAPPVTADEETSRQFSFKVSTLNRIFFLVARSDEERDAWMDSISQQSMFEWKPIAKGDRFPERTVHDFSDPSKGFVYVARNQKGECGLMTSIDGRADEILCHHSGSDEHGDVLVTREGTRAQWVAIRRGELLPPGAVFSGYTSTDGDLYVARCNGEFGKLNLSEGLAWSIWCHLNGQAQEGEVLCISSDASRSASPRQISRSTNSAAESEGVEEASAASSPVSRTETARSSLEDSQVFLAALEPKMTEAALPWWRSQMEEMTSRGQQAQVYADPPVDAQIGEGTYGHVWLARHRHTNELFAVKNMKTRNSGTREAIARNELAVAERIREQPHPCIVSLYMVEHFQLPRGGLYMLVMEFCPGGDLLKRIADRIAGDTYNPPPKILMWMGHIFLALEHLHLTVASLVRDLKPANVVLSRSGLAKLTDFGYGKLFTDSDGTWTYACPPGSPGYISPEVISQEPYNMRADFYSFGAMLWVALSGGWRELDSEPAPPVSRGRDFNAFKNDWRLLAQALQDPSMGRLAVSAEAAELILQLTQRDPAKRPDHAGIRNSRIFRQLELPEPGAATTAPGAIEAWQPPEGVRL